MRLLLNAVGGTNTVRYESDYTHLLALRSSSSLLFSFSHFLLFSLICYVFSRRLPSLSFPFLPLYYIILYFFIIKQIPSRLVWDSSEKSTSEPQNEYLLLFYLVLHPYCIVLSRLFSSLLLFSIPALECFRSISYMIIGIALPHLLSFPQIDANR